MSDPKCSVCGEDTDNLPTRFRYEGKVVCTSCFCANMSTFHKRSRDLETEVARLKELCLEAAGYIGLRSGPEVDKEADTMRERLIKAGGKKDGG